jgi:hypothetical protein
MQSVFLSTEPSWSIYRGFSYLHSRVILELQDEIRYLEKKLTDTEDLDLENGDGKRSRPRNNDRMQAKQLINTIREKLVHYGK